MAKRAHAYPQVDVAAAGLINAGLVSAPGAARVGEALRLARKRNAVAVIARQTTYVLREDLARATALGLEDLDARAIARPLPAVDAGASEVTVRRHLAAGAPVVVVRDRQAVIGGVASRRSEADTSGGPSLASRIQRGLPADIRATLETVGRLARGQGTHAFLVGGLVRDLLRGAPIATHDLDVVVTGDASTLARALARDLGGSLVEHTRFLTASVTTAAQGRIDIATARSERYESPGALPRVMPAGIAEDLRRRDFTINAMAVEIADAWELRDPFGGRVDLVRRRIRVLHPLGFVEDPTRIFRAARYATRLGFVLDAGTRRAQALALARGSYPALSGQRIASELQRILAEPRGEIALRRLGAAGGFRLLDARYRFTCLTGGRLAALPETLEWARARGLTLAPFELAVLVLGSDQPRNVRQSALARLALTGGPLARLLRILDEGPDLQVRLAAASAPSQRANLLRGRSALAIAWFWLTGTPARRRHLNRFIEAEREGGTALTGDDVLALGVPRGPAVAQVLRELRDARVDRAIRDRDAEVAYVQGWLALRREG